ncbi:enoyl-CoA hydratase/isomerase family protein [Alkalicoccus chagannorensis]|uniref:enoyl-CoA hydratase/isomerase family protein n=1 Tax=Alkalicoccus chagannorensis TaxID=427072 RepID=UPI0004026431|nr:enoyl-CoA hydratase/isomerase family protein [Alkalicoccus chagannorensis]
MRILIRRAPDGKITLQEGAGIAIITISRPAARNALTSAMWQELYHISREIPKNPKNRVVLIRGVPGNFTSGSDIKEFCSMSTEEADDAFRHMERAVASFEALDIPVVGAMDGPVYGAGFILALTFDIRIGTPRTKMGIPVARLGIRLGPAFVQRIVHRLGPDRANELVLLSRIYGHETAQRLGLLHTIAKEGEVDTEALKAAESITRLSRGAVTEFLQSVRSVQQPVEDPMHYADPEDFAEGCRAFAEKREPAFPSGRRTS